MLTQNIHVIEETFFLGYKLEFLFLIYISSVFSGILTIISKNPIISVLYLIALFLNISVYLIILGLNFIGISYLLVYVGAVSILFLFILMLINIRVSELVVDTYNSLPLATFIGILFLYSLYNILPFYIAYLGDNLLSNMFSNNNIIMQVTSKTWDYNLVESSQAAVIGYTIYTNYFIWIIITSLVLLLAMIGTLCLVIN